MSIERGDFDAVSESDLQELVDTNVPEGLRIDYKRKTYEKSGSEKREFLKDISALANSQGGHLVLGVEEGKGVAQSVVGIKFEGKDNVDKELLRLEQIAGSGLEPKIAGLRMRAIPLGNGNHVILIRVPRGWNPPYRVIANGSNRFYARHSAGVHEPDVEELRTLFTKSASAIEQARKFRDERIEKIRSGAGVRPLENNGRLFLHIVSVASFSGMAAIDVAVADGRHMDFAPLGVQVMQPRFNYHGFINERHGNKNHGYTQIFRYGALESTKANLIYENVNKLNIINGLIIEDEIFSRLDGYVIGLRELGVPPPLIVMLTLEGVRGAYYQVKDHVWDDGFEPPFSEDVLRLPECVLEDYGETIDHHRSIRPAFDALWNAIGYPRSMVFNDDGLWTGKFESR